MNKTQVESSFVDAATLLFVRIETNTYEDLKTNLDRYVNIKSSDHSVAVNSTSMKVFSTDFNTP